MRGWGDGSSGVLMRPLPSVRDSDAPPQTWPSEPQCVSVRRAQPTPLSEQQEVLLLAGGGGVQMTVNM